MELSKAYREEAEKKINILINEEDSIKEEEFKTEE